MACDWGNPGGPAPTAWYIYIYIYTRLLFLVFIAPPNDLSIVTSKLESPYGANGLQAVRRDAVWTSPHARFAVRAGVAPIRQRLPI